MKKLISKNSKNNPKYELSYTSFQHTCQWYVLTRWQCLLSWNKTFEKMSVVKSLGRWMSECHPGTWTYVICWFIFLAHGCMVSVDSSSWHTGVYTWILSFPEYAWRLAGSGFLFELCEVCGMNCRVFFAWHLRTTALLEGTECTGEMSAVSTGCRFEGIERVRSHILLISWQGICVADSTITSLHS